jgi:hypothetical protein
MKKIKVEERPSLKNDFQHFVSPSDYKRSEALYVVLSEGASLKEVFDLGDVALHDDVPIFPFDDVIHVRYKIPEDDASMKDFINRLPSIDGVLCAYITSYGELSLPDSEYFDEHDVQDRIVLFEKQSYKGIVVNIDLESCDFNRAIYCDTFIDLDQC